MQSFELVSTTGKRNPNKPAAAEQPSKAEPLPVPVLPLSGANTLAESCFAFQLSQGAPTEKRTIRDTELEIRDADGRTLEDSARKATAHTVAIFGAPPAKVRDKESLNPAAQAMAVIRALDDRIKTWLRSRCVAYPLADSVFLVPRPLLSEVETKLNEYETERREAISELRRVYRWGVDQARRDLGPLFHPAWYPESADLFCERYYVTRASIPLFIPDERLKSENEAFYNREQERVRDRLARAADEITLGMRASLLTLTEGLQASLTARDDTGRPKRFEASTVTKVRDWLDSFRYRNVTGDAELARVVEQARAALNGVDANAIKSSDATRAAVVASMATVSTTLAALGKARPTRKVRFDLDED